MGKKLLPLRFHILAQYLPHGGRVALFLEAIDLLFLIFPVTAKETADHAGSLPSATGELN